KAAPYYVGDVVTLTATPASGWTFQGWSGDLGGSTNPISLTLNTNKSVTATFVRVAATLTLTTSGQGTIGVDKAAPYYVGDVVTLTATPASGWTFQGWSGDLSGTTNPASLTLNTNKSVTATFVTTGPQLNIVKIGQGRVDVSPAPPYAPGTVVTVTFSPSNGQQFTSKPDVPPAMPGDPYAGWVFSHWSYVPESPQFTPSLTNPMQITMDGNKTLYATFLNIGSTCHPNATQENQLMSFVRGAWIGWDGLTQDQINQMYVKAENYLNDYRQYNEWWGQEGVSWWNNFNRTGQPDALDIIGDSMCFTGMHLAALSMKNACMPGDQQTIADINRVLDGIYRNIMITGTPGRTARFSGPTNNPAYYWYYNGYTQNGRYAGAAPWTDYTWLGWPSRDTHVGLFAGLACCLQYCQDPNILANTRAMVEIIIDRLQADSWNILDGKGHTTLNNSELQQLQRRVAYKANPGKYAGFASSISSYNLSLSTNNNLYETNGDYWINNLDWMRGFGITVLETNASKRAAFGNTWNNRYLARRLDMNSFLAGAACMFDPGVAPADAYATFIGGLLCIPDPIKWKREINLNWDPRFSYYNSEHVAQAALPHQCTSNDWNWQRSAALSVDGRNDLAINNPGFDMYMLYWMGRVSGKIPAPTP
ncbi:MAG TPA: hypothetical protein PKZ01_07900, partial [Candidatus Hydrogenedentes bacterium]|nr:hypothetical protein [Candidatus Hydrogenedentota bacterium]